MMVSVIIPVYNSADFIERTLSSVAAQTFRDFEIIVVDDGSKDASGEIVKKWTARDSRVRYFYKKNGGVSSARNLGLDMAVGEYITFLDSDDTYEPEFLEEMLQKITATGKDLCYCGFFFRAGGKIIGKSPEIFNIEEPLIYIIQDHWISTNSWMIRREYLEKYHFRFTEQLVCGEDFDFFCRLLYWNTDPCCVVKKYLTNYDLRVNSLSDKGKVWYSQTYIVESLNAYKNFCRVIGLHRNTSPIDYRQLMVVKMKRFYLRCLWGTLLLGSKEEFKLLYQNYKNDYSVYQFDIRLEELYYRIWETILSHSLYRNIWKWILRPYKYLQRCIRVHRIK